MISFVRVFASWAIDYKRNFHCEIQNWWCHDGKITQKIPLIQRSWFESHYLPLSLSRLYQHEFTLLFDDNLSFERLELFSVPSTQIGINRWVRCCMFHTRSILEGSPSDHEERKKGVWYNERRRFERNKQKYCFQISSISFAVLLRSRSRSFSSVIEASGDSQIDTNQKRIFRMRGDAMRNRKRRRH